MRGQGEQLRQPLSPGTTLDLGEQHLSPGATPIVVMHRQAGQLTHSGVGVAMQRRAADRHAVAVDHDVILDLVLQPLPGSGDQHAAGLERLEQREQAADVIQYRLPQLLVAILGDHGADPVAGEQLAKQRVVVVPGKQVRTADTVAGRAAGRAQMAGELAAGRLPFAQGVGFIRCQLALELAAVVVQPGRLSQQNQFIRLERHRDMLGDLRGVEIEDLAGAGVSQRRQDHQIAAGEQALDRLAAHAANFTAVIEIHPAAHAQRFRRHQIAGDGGKLDTMQRRVGQPQRELGFEIETVYRGDAFDVIHDLAIGDPAPLDAHRRDTGGFQRGTDLRPDAVDQHDPNAERMQQRQILQQLAASRRRHRFAFHQDDEGLATVGVDVGR